MQLEVGKILEGKITGITKFGAFVELEPGTVGMVHISEVSNTYVNDILEVLKMGETVKVKVLSIGDDKKISLSIKRALPPSPNQQNGNFRRPSNQGQGQGGRDSNRFSNRPQQASRPSNGGSAPRNNNAPRTGGSAPRSGAAPRTNGNNGAPKQFSSAPSSLPKGPASFEDMLNKFMSSSDEKISGMKKDHTVSRRAGSRRK